MACRQLVAVSAGPWFWAPVGTWFWVWDCPWSGAWTLDEGGELDVMRTITTLAASAMANAMTASSRRWLAAQVWEERVVMALMTTPLGDPDPGPVERGRLMRSDLAPRASKIGDDGT
jgi:hypothetical protein